MEQQQQLLLPVVRKYPALTPRTVATVMFRRRRTMLITFAAVVLGVLVAVILVPLQYPAEMKILVERERFDPVVTSNTTKDNAAAPVITKLSDEDVNSEVDLLQSQDLLREVVIATKLQDKLSWFKLLTLPARDEKTRIDAAVLGLAGGLDVEPPNKSNLITINYQTKDPQLTARVLQTLGDMYLKKHLEVHRPQGQSAFFQQEVQRYGEALDNMQSKLVDFTRKEGVVAADTEKQQVLLKLADFEAGLQTTQSAIHETEAHIRDVDAQIQQMAARRTTMVRTTASLLEQLKATLFTQEQQRTQLLQKFAPTYRLVQDLDQQIADTKVAIAGAEKAPTSERTTDIDPTYDWMVAELAKSRAELATMKARADSLSHTVAEYRALARRLAEKGIAQENLIQLARAAQDNYLNSVRKQEEVRMSQALDQQRIVNVAIAEHPYVPRLPKYTHLLELCLGLCLAGMMSIGVGFAADYWDPTFRTPDEMVDYLQVPALAAVPRFGTLPGSFMNSEKPEPPNGAGNHKD